jgi:hypothetical protein
MDGMLVEHLGVAPAVQETLDLKVKLVNKGSQPLEGGESHSLRHFYATALPSIRLFESTARRPKNSAILR